MSATGARNLVVKTAEWCGAFILAVVLLPLIAVGAFVARGLAVAGALAAVAALLLLCVFHRGTRARLGRVFAHAVPKTVTLWPVSRRRS